MEIIEFIIYGIIILLTMLVISFAMDNNTTLKSNLLIKQLKHSKTNVIRKIRMKWKKQEQSKEEVRP